MKNCFREKRTARDVAETLKAHNNLDGALSIAESALRDLSGGKQNWGVGDLPDYTRLSDDSHVADSLKKSLRQMERSKVKDLQDLKNFWAGVAGILRAQKKG
jgi:hypothetical protein